MKLRLFLALALLHVQAASALDITEWLPPRIGSPSRAGIHAYFSPNGGCTEAIVSALAEAKSTVLVQAYSFTSAPIAHALVEARRRGVDVRVILDKSQRGAHYSSAVFLAHASVPVWIDDQHAIAHNKIMLIDGKTIISGSFNFTKAAEEKNAENLLVIRNAKLAKQYTQNWEAHRQHSVPFNR